MTRKKVKLTWIVNDSARKASLKKRRVGLLKKVSELTTLCGVNAFVLIYSPEEREPQMWPSRPVVEQLLARFNNMPEMEKCKKMMNLETYLKERVGKVQDQLKKHSTKNKEMDVYQIMEQFHRGKPTDDFNINELHGLIWFSEEKKKEIRKRIEYYRQVHPLPLESLPPRSPPPQLPASVDSMAGVGGSISGDGRNPPESGLWDQWFIDMVNNSENVTGSSSAKAKTDIGLNSHQAFAANQMGLPHGNPRAYNIDSAMGMPQGNFNIGTSSSRLGGNNVGFDGNMGQPQENAGADSSAAGRELGLQNELFGGSITGNDVGMPYDVTRQWPGNFYP